MTGPPPAGSCDRRTSCTQPSSTSLAPANPKTNETWRIMKRGRACSGTTTAATRARPRAGEQPQEPAAVRCRPSATRSTSCTGWSSWCLCASWDSVSSNVQFQFMFPSFGLERKPRPVVASEKLNKARCCCRLSLCLNCFQGVTSVMTTRPLFSLKSFR